MSADADMKCVQYGYMSDGPDSGLAGQEDCLYLNVYAPVNRTDEPLPVMVWVYGGSLTAGSNKWLEYGPMLWLDRDVIIVEPLYRLGPLGFVSVNRQK